MSKNWITSGWVLAAMTLTALVADGCSVGVQQMISASSAEKIISQSLASGFSISPPPVSCPSNVPAKSGANFNCTAQVAGQPLPVSATVLNVHGEISIYPSKAVILASKLQSDIATKLTAQVHHQVSVSCPGPNIQVVPIATQIDCQATSEGFTNTVQVTVSDTKGGLEIHVLPSAAPAPK